MNETILVLGGGGFLGSEITKALIQQGHRVRIFDRRIRVLPGSAPDAGPSYIQGDFLNQSDLKKAMRGVGMVLHFISTTVPSLSADNVGVEIETNLRGTVRLLDTMASEGVTRICYPSSGGTVYGDATTPHEETDTLRPTCPYGLGKVLIEDTLKYYAERVGIQYQIWRIANPYGDTHNIHQAQGVVDAFLRQIKDGESVELWGDGSAIRDYIYIGDVVSAVLALLKIGAWGETVNIATGLGTSITDLIELIKGTLPVPVGVNKREGYTGTSVSVVSPQKLMRLTDWRQDYSLQDGIQETWRRLQVG